MLNETIDLGPSPSNPSNLPTRQLLQRISESNDYLLQIDNSSLEQFNVCSRSAEYYLVRNRERNSFGSALTFGGAIHKGLEPIMAFGTSPETLTKGIENIVKYFENKPVPVDEWRTPDRAINVLELYSKHYALELWSPVELDGKPQVELSFQLPLGEIELNSIININGFANRVDKILVAWTGRIDALVEWDAQLWVVDHKTSSIAGPSYWTDFQLSQPQMGYTWAASQLLDRRVSGTVINALFCRKPSKTGTPTEFARQRFLYTDEQLSEWKFNTLTLVSDFLSHLVRGYFPRMTKWCHGKYGECPYFPVCTSRQIDREAILSSSEYKDVTWNPLNDEN